MGRHYSVPVSTFISSDKATHNISIITKSGNLWDTEQAHAIEKGNLLHTILSRIKTVLDIDFAIHESISQGEVSVSQGNILKKDVLKIINHPNLKNYYAEEISSYNEKDIITPKGEIIRPDRLVFLTENEVVLIDYKTGTEKNEHIVQLNNYSSILEEMKLRVVKKILVYINSTITLKEI